MKKKPYDQLHLMPALIAESLCENTNLSDKQKKEFVEHADNWCRKAYECNAKWFLSCVKQKGNKGRDQLYVFINHWLDSYKKDHVYFNHVVVVEDKHLIDYAHVQNMYREAAKMNK